MKMTSKEFTRPSTTANLHRIPNPQLSEEWKKNQYSNSKENMYFQDMRPFSSGIR